MAQERSKVTVEHQPVPLAFESSGDEEHDPNHHLWRNGRLWWVAFTIHLPPWQKERVRLSLCTTDIEEARRRRDDILSLYPATRGCALSLRLQRPRRDRDTMPRPDRQPFAA